MTRLFHTGFEIKSLGASTDPMFPDGNITNGAPTFSTVVFRSGLTSISVTNSAEFIVGTANYFHATIGEQWLRIYFQKNSGSPASAATILVPGRSVFNANTSNVVTLKINTDNTLQWYVNTTPTGNSSPTIENNTWYCLEIQYNGSTGAAISKLDGFEFSNVTSGLGVSTNFDAWGLTNTSGNFTIWFDDVAINNSAGSENFSWVGPGKISLLLPISDNQRGSWTGGAGGTTNLYDAINNTPPIGTATETDLTQIESADSSGDNATDEYRINLTTYTNGGIPNVNLIKSVHLLVNHGEDIATGTKNIYFGGQANPSFTGSTVDVSLGTNGALGTYPAGWWWSKVIPSVASFLDAIRDNSPVINLRKTDTTTRVASVDFVGLYVDYAPASEPPVRRFPRPALNF